MRRRVESMLEVFPGDADQPLVFVVDDIRILEVFTESVPVSSPWCRGVAPTKLTNS